MNWSHLREFVLLKVGMLKGRLSTRLPELISPSCVASWHEQSEETAVGYEASWIGVFPRAGR